MATDSRDPEPDDRPDESSAGVEAAVNAFLDAQMGPEPTDHVETVDARTPPDDTGAAEWAERVNETRYGTG